MERRYRRLPRNGVAVGFGWIVAIMDRGGVETSILRVARALWNRPERGLCTMAASLGGAVELHGSVTVHEE